jgi:hypothetical protein
VEPEAAGGAAAAAGVGACRVGRAAGVSNEGVGADGRAAGTGTVGEEAGRERVVLGAGAGSSYEAKSTVTTFGSEAGAFVAVRRRTSTSTRIPA